MPLLETRKIDSAITFGMRHCSRQPEVTVMDTILEVIRKGDLTLTQLKVVEKELAKATEALRTRDVPCESLLDRVKDFRLAEGDDKILSLMGESDDLRRAVIHVTFTEESQSLWNVVKTYQLECGSSDFDVYISNLKQVIRVCGPRPFVLGLSTELLDLPAGGIDVYGEIVADSMYRGGSKAVQTLLTISKEIVLGAIRLVFDFWYSKHVDPQSSLWMTITDHLSKCDEPTAEAIVTYIGEKSGNPRSYVTERVKADLVAGFACQKK